MIKVSSFWATVIAVMFFLTPMGAGALTAQNVPKDLEEYAERAEDATAVLHEIMGIPEKGVPEELMAKAHAVAVIPHMVKGAFGIGGTYGKGLISQRKPSGMWSTPAFIEIGGGSFGLQLGVEASDLVLVFTNNEGVKSLLKGKVKLGADASVAAGPIGRKAQIGTDVLLRSSIYSYSRNKGLFAGVAVDGSAITMDDSANRKVYAKKVSGEDILLERSVKTTSIGKPFVDALEKYSPSSRQASRE